MMFIKNHRMELCIFLVAFCFQLVCFLIIGGREGLGAFAESDAKVYIQIGHNLLDYHTFSWSTEQPLIPDSFRMPLFPLLLAIIFTFTTQVVIISLVQNIIASGIVVLISLLAKRMFESRRVGYAVGLLVALEPYRAVYSNFVITEPLFTLFLVWSVYCLVQFLQTNRPKSLYSSMILLGLFLLTKPAAQYSIVIFLGAVLVMHFLKKNVVTWRHMLSGFAILILALLPWIVRNKIVFNHAALNSSQNFNLYHWYVPILYAEQHTISRPEAIELFYKTTLDRFPGIRTERFHNFEFSDYFKKESTKIILSNPLEYTKLHLTGSVYFFLTNGYRSMLMRLFGISEGSVVADPISIFAHSGLHGIVEYIKTLGGKPIIIILVGTLFVLLMNFFLFINLLFLRTSRTWLSELVLYAFIGYFALIVGPLASAAYKYPVQPFISLLAVAGLVRSVKWVKQRRSREVLDKV